MTPGQAVYAMRRNRGLKRSELAKVSGVAREIIWAVETGARSRHGAQIRTPERLAAGLGISVGQLFTPEAILLQDPLIQACAPYVRHLNAQQRSEILRTLQAITTPLWLRNGGGNAR